LKDHNDASADEFVLGIDEAGRGPVIGPMVYTGSIIQLSHHADLVKAGVADSKDLTEARRMEILKLLLNQNRVPSFHSFTRILTPEDIADAMTGKSAQSLNTLSHSTAVKIIHEAVMHCQGKLRAVFIDTVGRPEPYENAVKRRFPHLVVVVCPKADAIYPIVSAASIVAKTTRDSEIAKLGIDVGSGYPADPPALKFLAGHVHRFFGFSKQHHYIRHSWGPVKSLVRAHCVEITFEKDIDDMGLDSKQPQLQFKAPPESRDSLFQHVLGLQNIDAEGEQVIL
jgi:ribonuclease H2 subunit A